ncbi:ferredoxin--NADP reductase [Luteimicrobium xylanilyticum]|uniref:ferredoxin--NADP reductase n=1 Tax=Luteimicrobium xylanilyticum TaxID=1133546 RepID=UPI0018844EEA|nr:oxidoreductase [Luteimicrobium xylanilyticum]
MRDLAPAVREVALEVPDWPEHRAGQYVDVRWGTGPDALVRSYSIADAVLTDPNARTCRVELVIQLPADGAAPRANDLASAAPGTRVHVDGPKGERLTWAPGETGDRPLFLVAGGTGLVPLMSVLRAWARAERQGAVRLVHSVRSSAGLLFTEDLAALERSKPFELATVTTREAAPGSPRPAAGRLGALDLELFGWPPALVPECFVCGPPGFVDAVTRMLVQMGHSAACIRTERVVPLDA